MKFFAVSLWKSTGELFLSTTFGCQTPDTAEMQGLKKEVTYQDQIFVRVIGAENWNEANKKIKDMA